jgi:hypothetical protein
MGWKITGKEVEARAYHSYAAGKKVIAYGINISA